MRLTRDLYAGDLIAALRTFGYQTVLRRQRSAVPGRMARLGLQP
jgi:hypothetical protein